MTEGRLSWRPRSGKSVIYEGTWLLSGDVALCLEALYQACRFVCALVAVRPKGNQILSATSERPKPSGPPSKGRCYDSWAALPLP